jgi:hypothetical protein
MLKKIVISSSNTKAIAFLDDLSRKKDAIRKKLESKTIAGKTISNKKTD